MLYNWMRIKKYYEIYTKFIILFHPVRFEDLCKKELLRIKLR
jgi:hypothetical protein